MQRQRIVKSCPFFRESSVSIKFTALAFPVMVLLMSLKQKGPIHRFIKAGATTPATARKLASMDVRGPYWVSGSIRRGVLVEVGDGRYFVDLERYRRHRRRLLTVFTIVTVIAMALLAWVLIVFVE
jgi:hypothetical protein